MPRLDAERIALLRTLRTTVAAIERGIDAQLADAGVTLDWFELMAALQRAGGALRVNELRAHLRELPSSLSRRLDRMEEQGLVERRTADGSDRRAVSVCLTKHGRLVWRDANIAYRRAVQHRFGRVITDTDLAALQRLLAKLA